MDKITRQVRIEHWTQIMNECLNSGMNKTKWCRANGISDKQFFYWQRILRKEAFEASASKELSVITAPADETRPQKISFAEISLPIKQESVRNGFQPDIIIRKGAVSVEISIYICIRYINRTFAIRFRYLLMNAVASLPAFILFALSISHHFLTTNLRHLRQI